MDKHLDLRVRKTYTGLMNALLDLLKEKRFEEINVNELCSRAMVGRGTFYKHFSDKYEFFSFVFNEMLNHYLKEAENKINADDPCSYYVAFYEAFILFLNKNHDLFGPITSSSMTAVMLFSTSDTISQKLEEHLYMDVKQGHRLSIRPSYAARFLTGAMAQSARFLVSRSLNAEKEELIKDMNILIHHIFLS